MKTEPARTTRPTVGIGVAVFVAALGVAVLVHKYPGQLKAPGWVAFLALGLLGLAGVCIVAQALRLEGLGRWLVCLLLGGMAVIPAWIAIGGGARRCTTVLVGARSAVSDAVCRGSFGFGAIVLALMFGLAVRGALRSSRAQSSSHHATRDVVP